MKRILSVVLAGLSLGFAGPAAAWGDLGHRVTALIAYRHLTPGARSKLDALLASDPDPLTAPDFASRATWADKYRTDHRETSAWHFVDIEIDEPALASACFGFPRLGAGQAASAGPAQDCIVDKIGEFEAELSSPATPAAERLLALKFLIHFIGDVHQPLHASDHQDRGGNCIDLSPSPNGFSKNLHSYWDTGVVETLGPSADAIAATLDSRVTPAQRGGLAAGDAKTWALESFALARKDVYALPSRPTCDAHGAVALSDAYQAEARKDAALQLEKAGIRMAVVLNRALGR